MGTTETPDLPVQIIKPNGGPPLAVVPLPVLIALAALARKEIERAEDQEDAQNRIRDLTLKNLKMFAGRPGAGKTDLALWEKQLSKILVFDYEYKSPAASTEFGAIDSMKHQLKEELMDFIVVGREDSEDAADRAAYLEAKSADEELLPLSVVKRLAASEHPLKVFREHRGLTQAELAERVGTKAAYVSQIETGKRGGSQKLLRALARALDVELADVLTE